jgi:hypothetical protein
MFGIERMEVHSLCCDFQSLLMESEWARFQASGLCREFTVPEGDTELALQTTVPPYRREMLIGQFRANVDSSHHFFTDL